MKRGLFRKTNELYYFKDGRKVAGIHEYLWGYVAGIWGDVSGIWGEVSGIKGDVSGIKGDVDDCDISQDDRDAGINISDLVCGDAG